MSVSALLISVGVSTHSVIALYLLYRVLRGPSQLARNALQQLVLEVIDDVGVHQVENVNHGALGFFQRPAEPPAPHLEDGSDQAGLVLWRQFPQREEHAGLPVA